MCVFLIPVPQTAPLLSPLNILVAALFLMRRSLDGRLDVSRFVFFFHVAPRVCGDGYGPYATNGSLIPYECGSLLANRTLFLLLLLLEILF